MENLLELEIVSPEKKVFSGKVQSVSAPGILGEFQVLYNHAALVSTLDTGRIKVMNENNIEEIFATGGGVLEVKENKVSILAESIESKKEINVERAQKALTNAELALKDAKSSIEKEEIYNSKRRAQNRIRIAQK